MAGGWSEPCGGHERARGCCGEQCPAGCSGEQRDRALRQTVREEFDGYYPHIAVEMPEDIPAHVEARIAEVRDFFKGQFNEGARRVEQHAREHTEMFAAALREEAHRELISVEGSSASPSTCSGGAGASSTRRGAFRWLVLADWGAQLREEQAMVSEFQDTVLGMQAQVDEFVEQYAERTKRVIDRECSDVKKHERDLLEDAEALAWHEESVVTELRRELQQARLQVSRGSGLAEQQQRQ